MHNTEQSYVGKGDFISSSEPTATPLTPAASLAAQPLPSADDRQPTKPLAQSEQASFLDYLWLNEKITDDQREWSRVTPVPDDRMAPQLLVGGKVVIYLLDPREYKTRIGKVIALRLANSPDNAYQLGRLLSIDRQQLILSHDNPAFVDVTIQRKDVRSLHECIWTFNNPLL